jgi:transposase
VIVAGVKCKAHYFAMDLPQSDDCFVAAFPAETTEAFLEGHVRAFAYFEGVPRQILFAQSACALWKSAFNTTGSQPDATGPPFPG